MTAEWAQVLVSASIGLLQCGLIGWGLSLMRQSNVERQANTEVLKANAEVLQANAEVLRGVAETLSAHTETLNAHTDLGCDVF